MREITKKKYYQGLAHLQHTQTPIMQKDFTKVSRDIFGTFVMLHYLRRQGALSYDEINQAYKIRKDISVSDLINLYATEQHTAGMRASRKHRSNKKKLIMNDQINQDCLDVLSKMNIVFSSNEFGKALRLKGDYEKFIQYGNALYFIKKHCNSHMSNRMWIKKEKEKVTTIKISEKLMGHTTDALPYTTQAVVTPLDKDLFNYLSQYSSEQLVKELRDRGLKVTCKKITEIDL